MQQINFRLNNDEKLILQQIAEFKGVSIAEFVKRAVLKDLKEIRIKVAFESLKNGKIGQKRAFLLSGLTYNEFTLEKNQRGIQEHTSEEAFEKGIKKALDLDLKPFLRKNPV